MHRIPDLLSVTNVNSSPPSLPHGVKLSSVDLHLSGVLVCTLKYKVYIRNDRIAESLNLATQFILQAVHSNQHTLFE